MRAWTLTSCSLFLVLLACPSKDEDDDDDDDDADGGADTGSTADGGQGDSGDGGDPGDGGMDGGSTATDLDLACAWDGEGLNVSISGGTSPGYFLGMAETGTSDPWTGEDCYQGFTTGSGSTLQYCHELAPSGGFLLTVISVDQLTEGTTLFHPELQFAYYLEERSSGDCWIWGIGSSYYGPLGCRQMSWSCAE